MRCRSGCERSPTSRPCRAPPLPSWWSCRRLLQPGERGLNPAACHHGPVTESGSPMYRQDLAAVHHLGFGFHAAACAPGIVDFLAPVRARDGLVLELGCGTGLLTRELIAAGHRVIATDASE